LVDCSNGCKLADEHHYDESAMSQFSNERD